MRQTIRKTKALKHNILFKSVLLLLIVGTLFSCTSESPSTNVPVTSIVLNKSTVSLKVGSKETFIATVLPTNATNKEITWLSDKPTVAKVSNTGEVTALAVGTSSITAKTTDSNKTFTSTVTVIENTSPDKKISEGKDVDFVVARYMVEGENITASPKFKASDKNLIHQKKVDVHQKIWDELKKIISPKYRHFISFFEVLYKGDSNGQASPEKDDLTKWVIALNMELSIPDGIQYVAIHEFGHVLSLNNTQVDAYISDKESCPNFLVSEGCSRKRSYINQLYTRFWADIWEEYQLSEKNQVESKKFYTKYKDRFISEYASSDPGEDIAETFTEFILSSRPPPNSTKISDKKVLLLYEYSELVEWRNYVIKNIPIQDDSF